MINIDAEIAKLKDIFGEYLDHQVKSCVHEKKQLHPSKTRRKAAVLIPFFLEDDTLKLILTMRNPKVSIYPREMAFPGGKVEENDENIIETALRETSEEIGLHRNCIEIIGCLDDFSQHKRNVIGDESEHLFSISCIIGFIKGPFKLTLDENEVADVFYCPVTDLLENIELKKFDSFLLPICRVPFNQKVYAVYGLTFMIALLICKLLDLFPNEMEHVFVDIIRPMKNWHSLKMNCVYDYCIQRNATKKAFLNSNL